MTKTYNYTTQRGAHVEATITVDHITNKMINADGIVFEVACSEWNRRCDGCKVNGAEMPIHELSWTNGRIIIGHRAGGDIMTILPMEVVDEICAGERAEKEASLKAEAKYEAHREMMRKAMEE